MSCYKSEIRPFVGMTEDSIPAWTLIANKMPYWKKTQLTRILE